MKKYSLIIVEDHALLREIWTLMLNLQPAFHLILTCSTGEEAVQLMKEQPADLVMLDINWKGIDGINTSLIMKELHPEVKILCISPHISSVYVRKITAAGADGYLSRNSSLEELVWGLLTVAEGKKFLSHDIKNLLTDEMIQVKTKRDIYDLTGREMEIIELIKTGLTSKEIAAALSLAVKTIEVHRYNILRKLKLKNTAALMDYISRHIF